MARKRKDIIFPEHATARDQILREMEAARDNDAKWHEGKSFAYVYHANDEHYEFLKKATQMFFSENALSPMAFPSLKKFEARWDFLLSETCTLSQRPLKKLLLRCSERRHKQ